MMSNPSALRWFLALLGLLGALLVAGCSLPYPGPYNGTVIDAQTGKPISDAVVEAQWWCHDSPIPDSGGSFFVRSSTLTDGRGHFRLKKETSRGGLFGSSFVLKVSSDGYIPVCILADPSNTPLPESTESYPFIDTTQVREYPAEVLVKLKPAVPVWLKAIRSGVPFHQKVAREKLTEFFGVDHKYDADKWRQTSRSAAKSNDQAGRDSDASKEAGCPCPNAADRSGQPKEIRKKVRSLLNAAAAGETDKVKTLLDEGMDPNAQNYACRTALMKAAFMGRLEMVEFLVSKGAEVNMKDDNCFSALMNAASRYDSVAILKALLSNGAEVNARDKNGVMALMLAAQFGYTDAVGLLLSHGADVNAKDKDGETAWFKAAAASHKEVMAILESYGAKRGVE